MSFLAQNKLCKLVMEYGEAMIPHTCDVFPRQIHEFADRTEYALVSCCPEVIRLLNEVDIRDMTKEMFAWKSDEMYELRKLVIHIIMKAGNAADGLLEAFYVLLDVMEQGMGEYDQAFFKELGKAIAGMPVDAINTFEEVNELFLDIVENYRRQGVYDKYIEEISQIAEKLSEDYDREKLSQQLRFYQKEMVKYKELFQKYLISELFADGILPDSDVAELVMMLQWFSMEYVLIRHAVFLKTVYQAKEPDFEVICEYMVILSRMMGYNKEDIYEYMEACFSEMIWEWGYMALIVGEPGDS